MKSSFVKIGTSCLALPCLALPLLYAQAVEQVEQSKILTGALVGVSLLYSHSDLKSDPYDFSPHFSPNFLSHSKCCFGADFDKALIDSHKFELPAGRKQYCKIAPAVSFGYSFRRGNWYFGAIGEVSFGKNSKNYEVFNRRLSLESEISGFSGAFKLKGGYYFADPNILGYGIAGMKWRKVKTQFHYSDEENLVFSGTKSKLTNPQFILGVGTECPIYEKLSVFAEYEYAWRTSTETDVMTGVNGVYEHQMKQKLKEHSFKLGVNYYI